MNSNDETYNGWANRETWAVALHINNDQGWQESVHEQLREAIATDSDDFWNNVPTDAVAAVRAGDIIRENVEETFESFANGYTDNYDTAFGVVQDIGSLWRVDWTELGRSFLEDIAEDETEGCSYGMADRGTPGHDGSEGEDMPSSS